MKSRELLIMSALTMLTLTACGGDRTVYSPPPARPQRGVALSSAGPGAALARDDAPIPETTRFAAPQPSDLVLPNGLRIVMLERHSMPFVTVHVNVLGGEEDGATGVGSLTALSVFSGTKTRETVVLHQGLEERGAEFHGYATNVSSVLEFRTPSPNLSGVLERAADVVAHPIFDDAPSSHWDMSSGLHRMRVVLTTRLAEEKDNPAFVSQRALERLIDPASPTDADYKQAFESVPREEMVKFHATHFAPQRTLIVVVGDFKTADVTRDISRYFSEWRGDPQPLVATHEVAIKTAPQVVIIDRPGASQAAISVGAWMPNDLLSTEWRSANAFRYWLSGGFTGRLFRAVRENSGSSYGIYAANQYHRGYGVLRISGQVQTDGAVDAVQSIITELTKFATEPPTEAELREAQTRSNIVAFATNESAADTLSVLALTRDEPLPHFMERHLALQVPTTEELMRVAKAYFGREKLQIAIVGDAKKLEPELKAKGIGPITVQK